MENLYRQPENPEHRARSSPGGCGRILTPDSAPGGAAAEEHLAPRKQSRRGRSIGPFWPICRAQPASYARRVTCDECGAVADETTEGWRALLGSDPDEDELRKTTGV